MRRDRCIVLLSEKSSGSSAVQRLLAAATGARCVSKTRHFENETLYWTKAASVLRLPQARMLDSEVPIAQRAARRDLVTLLTRNLPDYHAPDDDRELIFEGWRRLCRHFGPVFFEKSPHHLFQWTNLELIRECMDRLDDVDFLLIGLVRDPIDTLYSQFTRWGTRPEQLQFQWMKAYRNLLRLEGELGARLIRVRYEDLTHSLDPLDPVFAFCGVDRPGDGEKLRPDSVAKWKRDRRFGFALAPEVRALAAEFGYASGGASPGAGLTWPVYREGMRTLLRLKGQLSPAVRWARGH